MLRGVPFLLGHLSPRSSSSSAAALVSPTVDVMSLSVTVLSEVLSLSASVLSEVLSLSASVVGPVTVNPSHGPCHCQPESWVLSPSTHVTVPSLACLSQSCVR